MPGKLSTFICQNCGSETSQYFGRCLNCNEWNTIVEEKKIPRSKTTNIKKTTNSKMFNEIEIEKISRFTSGFKEFDRVLGGGIVPGCVILIAGEPGIGKSTLLLQVSSKIKGSVLYVSGEESLTQIKIRSDRINFKKSDFYVLNETDSEKIFYNISKIKPNLLIIDSIQTVTSNLISNSSIKYGVDKVFSRKKNQALDNTPKLPVIRDTFIEAELHYKTKFDILIDLDATSPLRNVKDCLLYTSDAADE